MCEMWSSQVTVKVTVFWGMMPHSVVDTYCLSHYIVSWAGKELSAVALSFFERITHKTKHTVNIFSLITCTNIKYYGFFHAP